jgi:hypothetical protein
VVAQTVWTFTPKGLDQLLETLALRGIALDIDPPLPYRPKVSTVLHQLLIAEIYVNLIEEPSRALQQWAVLHISWQDGWNRKLEYEQREEIKRVYPDVWIGGRDSGLWEVLLEVDRGTEDGPTIRGTFERYSRVFSAMDRDEPRPRFIFACVSRSRVAFIEKIFASLDPRISTRLDNFSCVAIDDIGTSLRLRFLVHLKKGSPFWVSLALLAGTPAECRQTGR